MINEQVIVFYPVDVKNHFDVLKILDAVRTYYINNSIMIAREKAAEANVYKK